MNLGHFTSNSNTQIRAKSLSVDDAGLRTYMQRIYAYMTVGLSTTGLISWLWANATTDLIINSEGKEELVLTGLGQLFYGSPLAFIFMIAPLGIILMLGIRIQKMQASTAQNMFWLLCGIYGFSLASLFFSYTGESLCRAFFIASSTFLGASLYGYVTKKSLARLGSFLFMGLIGIIIASVVNIFLGSTQMQFIICILGVLIFTGLTAYDTQALKEMYVAGEDGETRVKKTVMGALRLYLDFINLFIMLLMLLGNRR